MPGESVKLTGFTPSTYDLVAGLAEEMYGHPALSHARPTVIPFESAAAVWFVLRALPDDRFPGGKWATVQHLEGLIDAARAKTGERTPDA